MSQLSERLQQVRETIRRAEAAAGREPGSVRLLAVSKTHPAEAVREAAAQGQTAFGENYLQEALEKQQALDDLNLDWHFIGPIQSNKTKSIAEYFDWVHSIDREKIARRLSEQRPAALPPLDVCLQINISGEASKAGLSPADAPAVARAIATLPRLRLRGLMAIPAPEDDPARQHLPFQRLRELLQLLNEQGLQLDTLSMGMTHDMDAAIAEGATMVRIGTAIFGPRT